MGVPSHLTFRVEPRHGVVRIALGGELNNTSVRILELRLAQFERDEVRGVILDLRKLASINWSTLVALLASRDREQTNGQRLVLVGISARARRLFELAGTALYYDEHEAFEVFSESTNRPTIRTLANVDA